HFSGSFVASWVTTTAVLVPKTPGSSGVLSGSIFFLDFLHELLTRRRSSDGIRTCIRNGPRTETRNGRLQLSILFLRHNRQVFLGCGQPSRRTAAVKQPSLAPSWCWGLRAAVKMARRHWGGGQHYNLVMLLNPPRPSELSGMGQGNLTYREHRLG
ncbi:hypothetical protein CSHISOI_10059, partial [Colletotrichum shisoi]